MQSNLAGLKIGEGQPVRVMGVINVSPESFYGGSVANKKTIVKAARRLEEEGADLIDVGAMSTAPYLKTVISEVEEAARLKWAVNLIRKASRLPISADTARALPAEIALDAGADIINDVTGLRRDPLMGHVVKKAKGLILMAWPDRKYAGRPIVAIRSILRENLTKALRSLPANRIVLDPGIGFFREQGLDWWKWDLAVLRKLEELRSLQRPLLVGVSRKSFIGKILNRPRPEDRLAGSLAATAVAVQNGAAIIRTHDVAITKEAIRLAELIRG